MASLPPELRELIESGPLVHLTTINADGSPQVSVVWAGLDGDQLLTAHLQRRVKVRNMQRDPRVALSFVGPRERVLLNPYAVLRARATVEEGSDRAWELLNDLTRIYVGPDEEFPAPRGPGYLVRYDVERISGVGPWVPDSH